MKTFISWVISQIEAIIALIVAGICCLAPELAARLTVNLEGLFDGGWSAVDGSIFAAIISIVVAIVAMIFTWRNFEETISRSMIWRRSNIDRFGMRLQYSLTIFVEVVVLCAILFLIFTPIKS